MLRVAITHDVDRVYKTYQYLTYSLKNVKKINFKELVYHLSSIFRNNPYWCFPEIIRIENEYNIKSTFFFLHETIPFRFFDTSNWALSLGRYSLKDENVINIIKYLDKNGWEIGLHGSYNSYKNIDLLKSEKLLLESILDQSIIGIRQHYLNLDHSTWKIQKKIGFSYDSTFGYKRRIGYKEDKYEPFNPLSVDFIVFPQVIMDFCFMDTKKRKTELLKLLDITEEKQSILVLNWHQRFFNENEFPGYTMAYIHIIEECIKRDAIFRTLGDYYRSQRDNNKKEDKCN